MGRANPTASGLQYEGSSSQPSISLYSFRNCFSRLCLRGSFLRASQARERERFSPGSGGKMIKKKNIFRFSFHSFATLLYYQIYENIFINVTPEMIWRKIKHDKEYDLRSFARAHTHTLCVCVSAREPTIEHRQTL